METGQSRNVEKSSPAALGTRRNPEHNCALEWTTSSQQQKSSRCDVCVCARDSPLTFQASLLSCSTSRPWRERRYGRSDGFGGSLPRRTRGAVCVGEALDAVASTVEDNREVGGNCLGCALFAERRAARIWMWRLQGSAWFLPLRSLVRLEAAHTGPRNIEAGQKVFSAFQGGFFALHSWWI